MICNYPREIPKIMMKGLKILKDLIEGSESKEKSSEEGQYMGEKDEK